MRVISNHTSQTHLTVIDKLLDNADEVIMCVAFLKNSGLNSIVAKLKHKVNKCQFFIGTDFFLTEPAALRKLFNDGHTVHITKKERTTYHPKIFYFKKDNTIDILIGSTNLTSGGLETNIEASFALTTTTNSEIENEFIEILASLRQHSLLITNDQIISDYEKRFIAYRNRHLQADKEFEIDLQQIIDLEIERENKLKLKSAQSSEDTTPRQSIIEIKPSDYKEFPIYLSKYIYYRTNIRNTGAVNKEYEDKDLVRWYNRMKELIKHEALPDDLALQLIDVDFPFDNAWGGTIKMMFDIRFKELLAFKEKEQKHLDFTYVKQTHNRENPYYKLGTWIAQQKQRRKEQNGSPWTNYEEQKMISINYLWDVPNNGSEPDDEGWSEWLVQLEEYYENPKNFKSIPHQNTKLGKWLNLQITNKLTGTRGKVKKYLHPVREALLGNVLKANGVEWEWKKQNERESIERIIDLWEELKNWDSKQGNNKPSETEQKRNSYIRQEIAQARNRSKKWTKPKDKWKLEMYIKVGFPLPTKDDDE
jgi:HKD family nuclease